MIFGLNASAQKGSDFLGRYYTYPDVGGLLIDQMGQLAPNSLLDLGAGAGALSAAAIRRWSGVRILTVDIDKTSCGLLAREMRPAEGNHVHILADALSPHLPEMVFSEVGQIDAAVCNPPFIAPKWRPGFGEILEAAGFSRCVGFNGGIDAALLFLAQNLRLISDGGTLGIILPDSIVSATKYKQLRKELLSRYHVHKVVRLPRGSFVGTDALASIAIVGKGTGTPNLVPLHKFDGRRQLSPALLVDVDAAAHRLDFDFHTQNFVAHPRQVQCLSLASIGCEIKRGHLSSSEARAAATPVFHTSDIGLSLSGQWLDLSEFGAGEKGQSGALRAAPGDILVARVGRNLEKKVAGVAVGNPLLTDCVYRVRVPDAYRDTVFAALCSAHGQSWLASRAYGVGAKQLTKADLLAFQFSC